MALFWFVLFPVLFILLFGAIFSKSDEISAFDVGLAVEDRGPMGQELSKAFQSVPAFKIHTGSRDQEIKAMKNGTRSLVVVLPPELTANAMQGRKTDIPIYYDASKSGNNQILLPAVRQVLDEAERAATQRPRLYTVQTRAVASTGLKTIDFLLPGVLAMALMQLGLFGSLRLVSLRERKILKRLGATPLSRTYLLGSEVAVRLLMAIIQAVLIIVIGYLVFDVVIVGQWWKVLGLIFLGALTFVSMGYMLVSFAKTEESGQGLIQVVQFPMMFLSGIFFPINIMPDFLRPVVKAIPLTYLGDALRQIMTGSPPMYSMTRDLTVLLIWLAVTLLFGIKFFEWE
jgi:ABC-2 type transport system permease protein